MAYTIDTIVDDAVYTLRNVLRDQIGEQISKNVTLHNPAIGDNIQDFMQAFEALTDGGMVSTSGSITVGVTGANATPGTSGPFSFVDNLLILDFVRVHPLNAAKTISKAFIIPAPAQAIYTLGTPPVMNIGADPGDFATAAGVTETFARVIGWLEDNLTYVAVDGSTTVGGFTYNPGGSGFMSDGRLLDGNPNS